MKEFEMTPEQHARIMDASKDVLYMIFNGKEPSSPQANANSAWAALGQELGFMHMTVAPVPGKNDFFFQAEVA